MPEAGPAEHELLRQSVRDFAANTSPETKVRRLMATPHGFDRRVWSIMASQLGLQGMAIPERYGGAGFGWAELAVVFEEFGRALLCAPYFATVALAGPALLASGDEGAKQRYLPAIASGDLVATVALRASAAGEVTATGTSGDGYELHDRRSHVIDGGIAGLLLVPALGPAGPASSPSRAPRRVSRETLPTLDETRKQAEIVFDGCPARPLEPAGGAAAIVAQVQHLAAVALACEQVGAVRGGPRGRARARRPAVRRRRAHGEGVLLGGVRPGRVGEHPGARRHRHHLGPLGAPVSQARLADPAVRDLVSDTAMHILAARAGSQRAHEAAATGRPGPEQSVGKLLWTQNLQRVSKVVSELLGPRLVAGTGEWGTYAWAKFVLAVPGIRISAGTDESMRNILAERVLGLPREKPSTRNQERT